MLSYQINQKLLSFLEVMESQKYLRQALVDLSNEYSSIIIEFSKTTLSIRPDNGAANLLDAAGKFNIVIDNAMKTVQPITARQIFNETNNIERAYREFLSNTNITYTQSIPELEVALSQFATDYDKYLNDIEVTEKRLHLFKFLASATSLYHSLNAIHNTLTAISPYYQTTDSSPSEQEGRLSILLESEMDFSNFLQKISAINIIYSELCALAGESYNNASPEIIKIESGSLWVEILGYPKIISLLESIIEGTIGYMYRTFTREGKIASIPRKVETIESILELRKKLKGVGIDTTDLDDNLQKASVVIAQEANNLLVGEPKLTMNNRVFTIGAALEKKYLESAKQPLLPEN